MAQDPNLITLLYKIARSYYDDGETQKQIAKRFGLSRIKVSRLLRQARQLQVVQITYNPGVSQSADLEHEVAARYGLQEVISIASSVYDQASLLPRLGQAASDYLVRRVQENEKIALTWGYSLLAMVNALPAKSWPGVCIVQCLGGLSEPDPSVNGAELVRRMAEAFSARPQLLYAPALVDSPEVRNSLLNDLQIAKTLQLAAAANIAVVGVGAILPSSITVKNRVLRESDIERLHQAGAVGDINLHFFNKDGETVEDPIHQRMIGLDLAQLKKIPTVIGVSGGEEKYSAIHAALLGKLINVLITDDQTLVRLLREQSAT